MKNLIEISELEKSLPFLHGQLGNVICRGIMKFLNLDALNALYNRNSIYQGPEFAQKILQDCKVSYSISGIEKLSKITGPFITISNHPYGGIDGIILADMIGHLFPNYKLIVNKLLEKVVALSDNFIPVTPNGRTALSPTADSISGIRAALTHIRNGNPLGIFPAGAVSDFSFKNMRVQDREWQLPIMRLIQKCHVPIVPIRFFDGNSALFYLLGLINWKIRVLRLPSEVFNKKGHTERVGIGNIISLEEQNEVKNIEEYTCLLRSSVYSMKLPD